MLFLAAFHHHLHKVLKLLILISFSRHRLSYSLLSLLIIWSRILLLLHRSILGLDEVHGVHSIDLIDECLVLLLTGGIVHQGVYIVFTSATVDLLALGFRFVNNVQNALWKEFLRVGGLSKDGAQLVLVLDGAIGEALLQSEAL